MTRALLSVIAGVVLIRLSHLDGLVILELPGLVLLIVSGALAHEAGARVSR